MLSVVVREPDMLKCLIRVGQWTAILCIWLVSDTGSYLVSDVFPFTEMDISKSSGM